MAKGTSRSQVVAWYRAGLSGPLIGALLNISSTAVYKHLRKAGVARRSLSEAQKRPSKQRYRRRGRKWEHRAVWEDKHGSIPPDHHIHHKDGNTHNNDPPNLELLPDTVHGHLHGKQGGRPRRVTSRA